MKPSKALKTLHRLTHAVGHTRDLDQALRTLATGMRQAMETDVCTVYLPDPDHPGGWILRATAGLNPDAVGRVRLPAGEGLVGQVAREEEPLNLGDAEKHPHFRYFPETGEEAFPAFLGVPILHRGEVLGVLCVQDRQRERFDEDHATLLFTAAAQIGGAIGHAQTLEWLSHTSPAPPQDPGEKGLGSAPFLRGQGGAEGVAIGPALAVFPPADLGSVADRRTSDPDGDKAAFRHALEAVEQELAELGDTLSEEVSEGGDLFQAYRHMLQDNSFRKRVEARIDEGVWNQTAVRDVVREHITAFESMDDPYLAERAADLRDLGRRLLAHLQPGPEGGFEEGAAAAILVGEEISPMHIASYAPEGLKGVVSATGSAGSHVAILAHAFGIPAVMGVEDLPVELLDGRSLVVDGYTGRIFVDPSEPVLEEYRDLEAQEAALAQWLDGLRDEPACTADGHPLTLHANTGLLADIEPALRSGAEGIGLYRTEFPFLTRDRFPSEDEQVGIYRRVLQALPGQPVTMRTLDIGGDKLLPYLPIEEDNPFLGWRGLRLSLDHPEIFLSQVRAIYRAADHTDVGLLLPMVTTAEELDRALGLIQRARHELLADGAEPLDLPVGTMIEVPSAVWQARAIARRADFLSIGTNDLTQYLLAVDRNNARVANLYDSLHPSVVDAIAQVVAAAHTEGRRVSVCGEMAGDPAGALLLTGLGVDALSMSSGALLRIKWVLRSFSFQHAQELADRARQDEFASTTRTRLESALVEAGLGGLIRAGE